MPDDPLIAAAHALRDARCVVALTGAGIFAESGVPTFRDALTGLWARYRPEDLATPQAFLRKPRLVWEWYAWRRELVRHAEPNAGHAALVELEGRQKDFLLLTQNVDGLHRRAGSNKVIELHGNLFANIRMADHANVADEDMTEDIPPRCKRTGDLVRPGVVWFGEALPADALQSAFDAARRCNVFLSIGTSTQVEPAASLPFLALHAGATVIEINPDATPLTPHCEYSLCGPAAMVLPALIAASRI